MKKTSIPHTRAIVDLKAIRSNLQALKRLARKNACTLPLRRRIKDNGLCAGDLLAVIKADAYGHGMLEAARLISKDKGVRIAVSDLAEGIALREAGIKGPVILLETSLPEEARDIIRYDLTPTVCGWELAGAINRAADCLRKPYPVHIKIDTGMGRQGIRLDQAYGLVSEMFCLKHVRVQGLYTHFPSADTDPVLTRRQIRIFQELIAKLDRDGLFIPFIHASNSMGLAAYRTGMFNLFRPGLMLYGLHPSPRLKKTIPLKPALSVKSRIILIKEIRKGEGISYGHTFTADRPIRTAVIPAGYNDGYFRAFSGRAQVLIAGRRCPVLGRVTMDQIVADISAVKNPQLGMDVVVLGSQGRRRITADELAQWAGTIPYEILCSLGGRLPRVISV